MQSVLLSVMKDLDLPTGVESAGRLQVDFACLTYRAGQRVAMSLRFRDRQSEERAREISACYWVNSLVVSSHTDRRGLVFGTVLATRPLRHIDARQVGGWRCFFPPCHHKSRNVRHRHPAATNMSSTTIVGWVYVSPLMPRFDETLCLRVANNGR